MQEVHDLLKKCQTYFIATVDGDQPRVRPFGTVNILRISCISKPVRLKMSLNRSWLIRKLRSVVCWTAESGFAWKPLLLRTTEWNPGKLCRCLPNLKSRYGPDDGNNQVFYLTKATATIYSFTEEPRVIKFG